MIKKKENLNVIKQFISGELFYWLFSIAIIIILFWLPNNLNSDKFYRFKNPDKFVCEQWKQPNSCIQGNCPNSDCFKFRKKTQAELDIDDCNNNPREDDLCKCKQSFDCINDAYVYRDYENINLSFRLKTQSPNFCYSKDMLDGFIIVNITTSMSNCIESRPKTDWEKHPEDYVAKIEYECISESNILCYSSEHPDLKPCGTVCERHCIKNQIVYHLKNECEKGNPNWVGITNIAACNEYGCLDGTKDWDITKSTIHGKPVIIKSNRTICREKTNEEKGEQKCKR